MLKKGKEMEISIPSCTVVTEKLKGLFIDLQKKTLEKPCCLGIRRDMSRSKVSSEDDALKRT